MRATRLWTAALLAVAGPALAQEKAPETPAQAGMPTREQAPLPAIAQGLQGAASALMGLTVPEASAFVQGDREIAAGTTQKGPLALIGTLRVAGTLDGDAFAYGGDILVLPGGHITGSAVAIAGRVQLSGGDVDGEVRALGGSFAPIVPVTVAAGTGHTVALTLGWAGVVLLIGIGVLVFGGRTLDVVGETVDRQFGRSFVIGVAATLGIVPVLALLVVALILTIFGILLIPFAIVAYTLAVIGVVTLGFLAAVCATGHSLARRGALTDRGAALRALVVGVAFFMGLWLVAAIATPWATVATVARVLAFAATWAAATVGLGATIISRAGTRAVDRVRAAESAAIPAPYERAAPTAPPEAAWLTPTPVSGVVAARRRTPAPPKAT
jgi:hypothetical protein